MTTVEREIAFGLENLGMKAEMITRLVEESLISLGLSRLRRAELATLSGGELQKVALAAVIAMQPQLLLLDEPTSQLDPVSSEELLAAVRRLAEDTGATILLAEHRVERCLHLATRVIYMEDGAVAADGEPQSFARWAADERRELLPPVTRLFARRLNGHLSQAEAEEELPMTVKDARRLLDFVPQAPRLRAARAACAASLLRPGPPSLRYAVWWPAIRPTIRCSTTSTSPCAPASSSPSWARTAPASRPWYATSTDSPGRWPARAPAGPRPQWPERRRGRSRLRRPRPEPQRLLRQRHRRRGDRLHAPEPRHQRRRAPAAGLCAPSTSWTFIPLLRPQSTRPLGR